MSQEIDIKPFIVPTPEVASPLTASTVPVEHTQQQSSSYPVVSWPPVAFQPMVASPPSMETAPPVVPPTSSSSSVPPAPQRLAIIVEGQDGNKIRFMTKNTYPLRKIMETYAERMHLNRQSLRFFFDDHRINDSETPADLDMEDGDVIDVVSDQTGGSSEI